MPFRLWAALAAALILIAAGAIAIVTSGSQRAKPTPRFHSSHHMTVVRPPFGSPMALRTPSRDSRRPRLENRPQIVPRHRIRRFGSAAAPVTGEVLSATTGTWTGNPTSYAYQWLDCDSTGTLASCVDIAFANTNTYTLVSLDIGHAIRVAVTASNPSGFATQSSLPTGVVTSGGGAAPAVTVAPAVTGTATQGQVLTTSNGTWSNTPTSYAYQWQDCDAEIACVPISGATSSTYTLAAADVDHKIEAVVTATNASGSGTAASNLSGLVASTATGGSTWNGTQEVGSASTVCNKYASTTGNDSTGDGSSGNPWATAQHLSDSLSSGQVGCLKAGTYATGNTQTTFNTPNITITAAPGVAALIEGYPLVYRGAAGSTFSYLNVAPTATGDKSFEIEASNITVEHDNVSDVGRGNPIGVGFATATTAGISGITIAYNRIHDWGFSPPFNHGIYISNANNSSFYDNWIWNGVDGSGINLTDEGAGDAGPYHDHIYANVISNTLLGLYLYEEGPLYKNNQVDHNVITDQVSTSTRGAGFESNTGTDPSNSFTTNDGYNNSFTWPCDPTYCFGITRSGNIQENPQYLTANTGSNTPDFRTQDPTLASWGLWDGDNSSTQTNILGSSEIAAGSGPQPNGWKDAVCSTAAATGTINRLTMYLQPSGIASGSQKIRGMIYSNSSGPASLLATSSELTFSSTSSAGWYDLPLTSPPSVTSGTTYCLGWIAGDTDQVIADRNNPGGSAYYYNANPYASGPANPFGSATAGTATVSLFAAIQ